MPDATRRPGGTAYTAAQLTEALRIVGVRSAADPEIRPSGATEDDVPMLLGALLAAAESGIYCQALRQNEWVTAGWFSATPANGRVNLLWRRTAQTAHDLAMGDTSQAANCARLAIRAAERLLAIAAMVSSRGHTGSVPTEEEQEAVAPLMRGAREAADALPAKIEQLAEVLAGMGYQG